MRKLTLRKLKQKADYRMLYRIFLVLLIFIFSVGCNNQPADLQAKKKACVMKYDELIAREDTVKMDWEYDRLVTDYTKLKKDVVDYTAESNKRGFSINNDEVLKDISQKILYFKKMSKPTEGYSNYSISSSSIYSSNKSCSWCGKLFSGTHYTHLGKLSDCYSTDSSTSIGIYCSKKCCSEARRSSCSSCR